MIYGTLPSPLLRKALYCRRNSHCEANGHGFFYHEMIDTVENKRIIYDTLPESLVFAKPRRA